MIVKRLFAWAACWLSVLLLAWGQPLTVWAQQGTPPQLQIVILEGEGALSNVRQRVAREPIVQVQDENHKPIAGAAVIFSLPESGASGTFANGSRVLTVFTDDTGRAVGAGLKPNSVTGQYQIRVTAQYHGQTAYTTINRTNTSGGSAEHVATHGVAVKAIVVGALVAAGVAAGVIAARSGGGTHSTSVTPGVPVIGAP